MSEITDYLNSEIQDKVDFMIDVMSDSILVGKEALIRVLDELFNLGLLDMTEFKNFINRFDEDCEIIN